MAGSFKRVGWRLFALALGLGIAVVAAEGTLRVLRLAPAGGLRTVTEGEFERIPGLFGPGQIVDNASHPRLPHRIQVNGLGYRGVDLPVRKVSGEVRILMVGDSFTFGDYVDDDETLPARIELGLARSCPGVRVINAGVGGTTIVTHARMVERGLALDPDLVVLTFSENDVRDLGSVPMWEQFAANRRLKSHFPMSWFYPLLHRSALWHLALEARERLEWRLSQPPPSPEAEGDAEGGAERVARAPKPYDRHRPYYAAALGELSDRLASHGIPLVFAVYPSHKSLRRAGFSNQYVWVLSMAARRHIPTIDLMPSLRESGVPVDDLYLLPHDGHPSPLGYAITAEHLAVLLRSGPLASRCDTARIASR